ncbi:MAG: monofunctional biosynthetic peptidoglycan transglycosylase [candidate division Zixibacteria bacterium]|nr:monofunctional biosynthetic peptidoglycan transglycosylase [candidate division Zixibacteria bacterium]
MRVPKMGQFKWQYILLILLLTIVFIFFLEYLTLPDVSYLQKENPKTTSLIQIRNKEHKKRGKKPVEYRVWVPYSQISPYLKKAILVGEDINFYRHSGIDLEEMKESLKINWKNKGFSRGASTITQQLAKNLYLSPSKNPFRKLREILIAFRLERSLSKRRIFELYLNLVEWGDGIYGCEAASRYYFGKSSSELSPDEAIRMATSLPFPRKYPPTSEKKRFEKRRKLILSRMIKYGFVTQEEYDSSFTPQADTIQLNQ